MSRWPSPATPPYPDYPHEAADARRAGAPVRHGSHMAPAAHPTAPRYPAGTSNAQVSDAAPVARLAEPVMDPRAAVLAEAGLDALEIERFPSAPSLFDRFNALEETVELIAGILDAAKPKAPIYEQKQIGVESAGFLLNRHGRQYVGFRTNVASAKLIFVTLAGQIQASIGTAFSYYLLPDLTNIFAQGSASAGVYELVYVDNIGGAVPQ